MKRIIAILLVTFMGLSLCSCGKPKKTENMLEAESAIKAIGKVNENSGALIEKAEKAVAELSAQEKDNLEMLDELEDARKEYNDILETAKAKEVIDLIDALGDVSLAEGDKVSQAEKAYNALTEEAKKKVTNKGKLEKSIKSLEELRTKEKERVIAEKTALFSVDYDKVEGVTWYQPKAMPNYIDIRSYIIPYIGSSNGNYWVCIRYNYTADSWIFWESMTIMVDGEKYYKNVGRSNTIRDNDTEVWEYYDEVLGNNVDMTNKDIQMLRAIAESEETIIRFQGDEYHYDLTVTAADKKMISDTLALYEAFTW